MHVVMLTPDSQMIDRRILLEARTLTRAGHRVTLLGGFECRDAQCYNEDGVEVHRLQYDWDDERLKKIRALLPNNDDIKMFANRVFMYVARRIMEINPFDQFMISKALAFDADVYHVHDLPCLKAGVFAARERQVPLVYDAHELYHAQSVLSREYQRRYFLMEKKYIRKANKVITVNPFIADLMAKQYSIPTPHVIMNCTDLPKDYSPHTARERLHEKGNIPKDHRVVLFQGWLSAERNIETCVRGAAFFGKSVSLAIIGYGGHEPALRRLAKDLGVEDRVHFLGAVPSEEMLNYSAGADLGVIPYLPIDDNHRYCSPNKFFEYVLAGVPMVTHRLPFFELMNEQYGVVATTNMASAEAFGKTVTEILDTPVKLSEMRAQCLKATSELNWTTEGEKLLAIYGNLLE